MSTLRLRKLEVGSFENNCYILSCSEIRDAVIIDPAADAPRILEESEGLIVRYVLITHGHSDHTGALTQVRSSTGALVGIHPLDAHMLPIPPDVHIQDGDSIRFGELGLKVLHTPGHSPGGTCFLIDKHLFTGDTIFPGGPGNTALLRADYSQIMKSIWEKIFTLPDDTVIYPGHGANTTVGREKLSEIYGSPPD